MQDDTQKPHKYRALFEYGPLLLFFVTNFGAPRFGVEKPLIIATSVLVIATALAVLASWILEKRVPMLTLLGGVAVAFFGGLTIFFDDPIFIKVKPTIISGLFALFLGLGQLIGKMPLKLILSSQLQLTDKGWVQIGWIWTAMFASTALANEIAWRLLSTDGWVTFKVFGLTGISIVFAVLSVPVMTRHQIQK